MNGEIKSLSDIKGGVVDDLFCEAWNDLLDNLSDPNVKPDAVREIVLKVKVKPTDQLLGPAQVSVEISKKLPGIMPTGGSVIIDRTNGKIGVHNWDPNQEQFDFDNVKPIYDKKGAPND